SLTRSFEFLFWVERLEQLLAHVKFLGELLTRAAVADLRQVLHLLELLWNLVEERSAQVVIRGGVFDQNRIGAGGRELLPELLGQLVGRVSALRRGKSRQRLLEVFAILAVDLAGRKMRAVEQDLRL